jgi:hypothetical protein
MILCITENMNPNYSMIPCFVEKKIQNNIKNLCYIKTRFVIFYCKYLQLFLFFLKTPYFFFSFLFHSLFKTLSFWTIPSHIIMI